LSLFVNAMGLVFVFVGVIFSLETKSNGQAGMRIKPTELA